MYWDVASLFSEYWRVNNCPEPKIMTKKAKDKCNDKFGSGCGRSGRELGMDGDGERKGGKGGRET